MPIIMFPSLAITYKLKYLGDLYGIRISAINNLPDIIVFYSVLS